MAKGFCEQQAGSTPSLGTGGLLLLDLEGSTSGHTLSTREADGDPAGRGGL